MDIKKIFKQFDPETQLENSIDALWVDTPRYKLEMAQKLIKNHNTFLQKTIDYFKHNDPKFNTDDLVENGNFVVFNRAFQYLKQLDLQNKDHKLIVRLHGTKCLTELYMALRFFEEEEEYEKCAVIYKLIKYLSN